MKYILLIFLVLICSLITSDALPRRLSKSTTQSGDGSVYYFMTQETASYPGGTVKTYLTTHTTWSVVSRFGVSEDAKGVRILVGSAGGNLEVHLVQNPDDVWDIYSFPAVSVTSLPLVQGMIFDKIRVTNTTIDLAYVMILL